MLGTNVFFFLNPTPRADWVHFYSPMKYDFYWFDTFYLLNYKFPSSDLHKKANNCLFPAILLSIENNFI